MRSFVISFVIGLLAAFLWSTRHSNYQPNIFSEIPLGDACIGSNPNEDRKLFCEEYRKCMNRKGFFTPDENSSDLRFICEGGE